MAGIGKYIKGKSFSKMFAKKSPFNLISLGLINAPQSMKYKSDDDTDIDVDTDIDASTKVKQKNVGNVKQRGRGRHSA